MTIDNATGRVNFKRSLLTPNKSIGFRESVGSKIMRITTPEMFIVIDKSYL